MLPRQATTLLSAAASSTMLLGWKALLTDVSFCKLEILVFTYGAMARVSLLVGDLSSTRLHETNCSYCNGRNLSHIYKEHLIGIACQHGACGHGSDITKGQRRVCIKPESVVNTSVNQAACFRQHGWAGLTLSTVTY